MKSGGHIALNASVACGYPSVAHDATAESNQTSKTSSTLRIVPPHSHPKVTSSTHGLCRSDGAEDDLSLSSSTVPITSYLLHESQTQIGIGTPQYRCRDMHQSRAPETQSWNLAEPAHSGYQITFAISLSIASLSSEIFRNHCSVAR
uniref:Uncharacterized protein n=1 Tax=Candidatus Methanogaster sp. ANME-2c ERB4 TaxID=2759911 RepID=A0A7G9YGZ4_9EURY|nr:hypothetical protein BDMKHGCF_00021 [Methanosarcinales archaeon ANME-2c ERB4]